ncbi:MAG: hypothetical protein GY822_06560 [Deltaproteobacteria bacterium]|nr:hypothetical protein [Deltaproteobacteria bacterium]
MGVGFRWLFQVIGRRQLRRLVKAFTSKHHNTPTKKTTSTKNDSTPADSSSAFEARACNSAAFCSRSKKYAELAGSQKKEIAECGVDVKDLKFDLQKRKSPSSFTLGVFMGPSTKREFVGRVDVFIDGKNMGSPSLMSLRPKFHGKGLGSFFTFSGSCALDQSGAGYQSTILSSDAETAVCQNFQARGMASSETDANKETVYTLNDDVLSDATLKDLSLTLAGQTIPENTNELPYAKDTYTMEEPDVPSWSLR